MKQIEPIQLSSLHRKADIGDGGYREPSFRFVAPTDLFIDERYQRLLSKQSLRLIRKIVCEWDWMAYKPPICAQVGDELHVIDGQHTALAAASHGGLETIPVIVVPPSTLEARAESFVRHNRDRLAVSATQLYYARLTAGDRDALTVQQVCQRSGVRVLRFSPAGHIQTKRYQVGDTLAIKSIEGLIQRQNVKGACDVLELIVQAGIAPITFKIIRAVDELMFSKRYRHEISQEQILYCLGHGYDRLEDEGDLIALEHNLPRWRGLCIAVFKRRRKGKIAA